MDGRNDKRVVVSIVSHGQGDLVRGLLDDLRGKCDCSALVIVVTANIPEELPFTPGDYPYPVVVIRNSVPKGYGANHNAAFRVMDGEIFCALNPDIRLTGDPFPLLRQSLVDLGAGLVAPMILSPGGGVEDSARRIITPWRIVKRRLRLDKRLDYEVGDSPIAPDWIAGMFLLFSSRAFADVGGFDEHFYLYCEDADICARLRKEGYGVWLVPSVAVIHDARRKSRRDLKYMWWHVRSLVRYCAVHGTWLGPASTSAKPAGPRTKTAREQE